MNEDKLILTKDEALSLLSDDESIHTFRNISNILIASDWDREELVDAINHCKCEIGGPMCRALDHGLVIWTGDDPLFVETKEGTLEELERNCNV